MEQWLPLRSPTGEIQTIRLFASKLCEQLMQAGGSGASWTTVLPSIACLPAAAVKLPLSWSGAGEGSELRQPLGIAVVGGLCVSQLLTLFITPVVYLYLDRIDRVLKRRLEPQLQEVEEHPRPAAVAAE